MHAVPVSAKNSASSAADEKDRGRAFGLEGLGENAGAFLGPLLTVFLLYARHVRGHRPWFCPAATRMSARCISPWLRAARNWPFGCRAARLRRSTPPPEPPRPEPGAVRSPPARAAPSRRKPLQ